MTQNDWTARLEELSATAPAAVRAAADAEALERLRVELLGRGGKLTGLLKELKDLPLEARRDRGPRAQALKDELQAALDRRKAAFAGAALAAQLSGERVDASLPPPPWPRGRLHPITATIREMTAILGRMGFAQADGPLVETEYYNFEALNIPEEHSARDMQDTFYLRGTAAPLLLRTHTSPVQIRHLEKNKPPVRICAPGRVFRHEAVDAGHSAVFHQVEGLYVDRGVTMADLKGALDDFVKGLFGPGTRTRLRPSYFPFTEPSAEVDVQCLLCGGGGCPACKQEGWMEMLGAGVVNPAVLRAVGLDPAEWSGYAFGVGVERVAMLRFGVPDIRMFYDNDLRFLEQFG